MGSNRLPGKVLKDIRDGVPMLDFMLRRVMLSKLLDTVVVVTSDRTADNQISDYCRLNNIQCFRGSEQDVLDRFCRAAISVKGARHVVRLTADCVLHHGQTIDQVIQWYLSEDVDYFSNSNREPDVLEDGFDVEVFTVDALKKAAFEATLKSEREHVTPYIKNSGLFRCGWRKTMKRYRYKLSVDTLEDFGLAQKIIEHFGANLAFSMADVVRLLEARPELLQLNKSSVVNAGYAKSLETDCETVPGSD